MFIRMDQKAFTLIEMLVVISIMVLLSTMIVLAYRGSDSDAITRDAYELQTVLQRARTMAMSSGKMHAVTFHIENAGDGSVFKNRSDSDSENFPGRHWYCIIGPDNSNLGRYVRRSSDKPPMALRYWGRSEYTFLFLGDYTKRMKQAQIGPTYYLSPGVRFLALTDTDDIHSFDTHPTYPRPWFGYYDDTENRLYAWGGYDPDLDLTFNHPNTALDYQGMDGPIPYDANRDTNINPSEVWGRLSMDANAIYSGQIGDEDKALKFQLGATGNFKGPDVSILASVGTKTVPRPVVNGYWSDFMILFNARGEASIARSHSRSVYFQWSNQAAGRNDMGMENEELLSGGYSITLCRDIDSNKDAELYRGVNPVTSQPAYNKFNSVEDAFASISPFLRVFISRTTGKSEVRNNDHPHMQITPADMLGHDPHPRGFK